MVDFLFDAVSSVGGAADAGFAVVVSTSFRELNGELIL